MRSFAFAALVGSAVSAEGPCDIFAANEPPTPCVAAHSTTRALYGAYNGPLYQVKRASDGQLRDVSTASAGGVADAAAQDTFCAGTGCVIWRIYDQSPMANHMDIAPPGGAARHEDRPTNATRDPLTLGGAAVYSAYFEGGMGYRIDNTTGVAVGDEAETIYMVTSGTHFNDRCCFDYGNAETDNLDDGAGTMEALYFGNAKGGLNHGGAGKGPWIMADMENALWGADVVKSNETPINHAFVTAMIKCDSSPPVPPPSPAPSKPGAATTTADHDICPGSGDLSNFPTADADTCNEACYGNPSCAAYVLHTGTCYLKSCTGPLVAKSGSTVGQLPGRADIFKGHWSIKGGDAQTGELTTYWDGPRAKGYAPMKKQGAIILGIGGDNSDGAVGTFYEGAITKGVSSNATDAKLQANIVAAGYGK